MPISNPKAADDVLRARDAQTVVTSGIDAGPADDADMEKSAAAKQMAGDRLTSRLWGPLLIGLGVVLIVALAIIAS
jgi:hypothetical protein